MTPPSVHVTAVQLEGIGIASQQLGVTLCVTNPNNRPLDFRRVTADLNLEGAPLAAGASDVPVRLPPNSSVVVPFTVVLTEQNAGAQLARIFQTGQIDYRLHGTVTLEGGLPLTVPYGRSGRFDIFGDGPALAARLSDAPASPPACTG